MPSDPHPTSGVAVRTLNGQEQRICYCLEGHTMEIDGTRMLIGLVIGITLLIMLVLA